MLLRKLLLIFVAAILASIQSPATATTIGLQSSLTGGIGAANCNYDSASHEFIGGTCTYFVRGDTGVAKLAPSIGCVNAISYGADPTHSAFSDAVWTAVTTAALTADPGHPCIYFPHGAYKFASAKSVSLSGSYPTASIALVGDGADTTTFDFPNGTSGVALNLSSNAQSVHAHGFSILAGAPPTGGTIGFAINQAAANSDPAQSPLTTIWDVTVRGNDGYTVTTNNAFVTGIDLNNISSVNLTAFVTGTSKNDGTTCIQFRGQATISNAVALNLIGTTSNNCSNGFVVLEHTQGVTVSQSNLTGNFVGIAVPANQMDNSQLAIVNSQIKSYVSDIAVFSPIDDLVISGNSLGFDATYFPGSIVSVTKPNGFIISNNEIAAGGAMTTNGILISNYYGRTGIIEGNIFHSINNVGIALDATSQWVTIGINTMSCVTTPYQNSGSNNTIVYTPTSHC